MARTLLLVLSLLSLAVAACTAALSLHDNSSSSFFLLNNDVSADPPIDILLKNITLPSDKYKIELWADNMPFSRSLDRSPRGTIFVGSFNFNDPLNTPSAVYAITHKEDYTVDKIYPIAQNLTIPNGVAFKDGDLYIALNDKVIVLRDIESRLANPPAPEHVIDLIDASTVTPDKTWHGWRYIRANDRFPDDPHLYVAIGAPCNTPLDPNGGTCACLLVNHPACKDVPGCMDCAAGKAPGPLQHLSQIVRFNPRDAKPQLETVLTGTRNSLGIAFDPHTGEMWFSENSRDNMDPDHSNRPPDELNRVPRQNVPPSFGYPFCYGKSLVDPSFNYAGNCNGFVPAAQELGPHVAALGIRFTDVSSFPEYRHGIFVAQHGSWNSDTLRGYSIAFVGLTDSVPNEYVTFAGPFIYNGLAWGRPVDIEFLDDGSMLVSNDRRGEIYRISRKNE